MNILDVKNVDINKVLNDKNLPNWILKAAFELKNNGFLPAGDYFEKLDDVEVYEMNSSLEYINTINYEQFELLSKRAIEDLHNLSLLCFILALGEGEIEVTTESLSSMLQYLFLIVNIENLYREGKVDVIRENYSLFSTLKPAVKSRK